MTLQLPAGAVFRAETGAAAYDSIRFSGRPQADLLSYPGSRIDVVRHIGVRGPGMAMATSLNGDFDALMVNLTSSGRYRGRCGDTAIDTTLQRGHVSFVPGQYVTELEFPAAHNVLALFIPSREMQRIVAELGADDIKPMASERQDRLAQLIAMVETEIRSPGFAADLMLDGLMRAIGTIMVRHDTVPSGHSPGRIRLSPARLARVIDFVEARLDQEISLADMAQVAGLSPFHFSRVFKLATGETPYHFLGSRRLNRARALLLGGPMPLAELALHCGFASQSHFTAAFTKAMGMPPGRFRKHRRS
ncbi:helix-turn-helix domain-containing protein [Sphingomonas sp. 28-63-12]|uniref:helix-turn-helix domain-containing protein n=1 Tax=Sphingomonas sp. 28-63-12 TaxID=1970434 RepID=UPI0035A95E02